MDTKPTKIDFVQYHKPALESGEYRITVNQKLTIEGDEKLNEILTKRFYVAGERFHILPEHIGAVFPPAHGLGEYSNVFPHITLSRNTLPWEREAITGDVATPWLALLLIHEEEASAVEIPKVPVTLAELEVASTSTPFFPGLADLEPGQTEDTKVSVLDIRKSLLEKILPDKTALNFLSHIRQGKDDSGHLVGEDLAVLIANRLPRKGAVNTVHLVSLENRYARDGTFDYQGAGDEDKIRLVTLYSWQFTSSEYFKVSETFLQRASDLPDPIKAKLSVLKAQEYFTEDTFKKALTTTAAFTAEELEDHQEAIFKDFAYGDFAKILKHLDRATTTLRLPDVGNEVTDAYLRTGFYPLPHKMRQGAQTVSWYHGPLSPRSNDEPFHFPARGSDELLRYYPSNGMFDISYAAAWELGRLLALQNTRFSTSLYQWKRGYAQSFYRQIQADETKHLLGAGGDQSPDPLPESLADWFRDLEHLKGIPFNYLVPDETLLPIESIRFFQLDRRWVESLLDGAFSIGRVTSKDHELDVTIAREEELLTAREISGFILRSEAVSGWPGMQVEGFQSVPAGDNENSMNESDKLVMLRRDKLSDNVLLCLFEGDLQTLDIHLKPEVLHFGVNENDQGDYQKELRNENGEEQAKNNIDIPMNENKTLRVKELLENIRAHKADIAWPKDKALETSANLALQLLEGVEKVRFIK